MSDRRHSYGPMIRERDGKSSSGRNHRDQKERDHRAEIQKTAIRVCGDWSEHISSSGKKYFYNCKTEQSQWEVPKDWVERQEKSSRPSRNDNGRDERHERDRTHGKAGSSYRSDDRHRHHHHPKHQRGLDRYDRGDRHHDRHDRDRDRYHNAHHKPSANHHHHHNNSYSGGHSNRRENDRRENEDTRQTEDMEISPGSTPTEESGFERNMAHNHPSSSTPSAINSNISVSMSSGNTPRSSASNMDTVNSLPQNTLSPHDVDKQLRSLNNQQMTREAIRTLAQLQQALQQAQQQQQQQQQQRKVQNIVQQIKQQIDQAQQQSKAPHNSVMDEGSQSPYSPPDSDGTPLQSPEARPSSNVLLRLQEEEARGQESPCQSEVSLKSSSKRGSPAPSHSSSQSVPVATSQLAAAHRKNDDSVHLTPSLANYYNDKLIDHVSNKPADAVEAQSDRVREDGLHVGSIQCTQVSAELKRDRSLVRLAEIQCTLQEQRVLFLRQQIKELENL